MDERTSGGRSSNPVQGCDVVDEKLLACVTPCDEPGACEAVPSAQFHMNGHQPQLQSTVPELRYELWLICPILCEGSAEIAATLHVSCSMCFRCRTCCSFVRRKEGMFWFVCRIQARLQSRSFAGRSLSTSCEEEQEQQATALHQIRAAVYICFGQKQLLPAMQTWYFTVCLLQYLCKAHCQAYRGFTAKQCNKASLDYL